MFGNFELSDIIAYRCASIDVFCRGELRSGIIANERDYISVLCSRIRDALNLSYDMTCHAQTTTKRDEELNGVDGIIIFKYDQCVKVGIFEGKRPQLNKTDYNWDYLTKRGTSHFSEQIEKQHKWHEAIAIWEMFFNEGVEGAFSPSHDGFGSSCVWHNDAYNFMNTNSLIFNKWTTGGLNRLLDSSFVSFYSIIYDIISCRMGKIFNINLSNATTRVYNSANDNWVLNIPLPLEPFVDAGPRIQRFLTQNNLTEYLYIDLDTYRF